MIPQSDAIQSKGDPEEKSGWLAGVIGLCLGRTTLVALAVALGAGTAYGLVKVLREGRAARRATVPFGPFLALGALGGVISLLAA